MQSHENHEARKISAAALAMHTSALSSLLLGKGGDEGVGVELSPGGNFTAEVSTGHGPN